MSNNAVHCDSQQPVLVTITLQDSGDQPLNQPLQPSPGHRGAQGVPAPPQAAAQGNKPGTVQSAAPTLCWQKVKSTGAWSCEADSKLPNHGGKQAAGSTHPPQKLQAGRHMLPC